MKIYSFIYCGDIYDSAHATVSIHKTKAGAFNAMRKHKLESFIHWYDSRIIYGKKYNDSFGKYEDWDIKELELLD